MSANPYAPYRVAPPAPQRIDDVVEELQRLKAIYGNLPVENADEEPATAHMAMKAGRAAVVLIR